MADERYQLANKVSWITMLGNVVLTLIKTAIGIIANSTALIADALHSASDIATTVVVLYSIRISKQPPDSRHLYGHGRAESIGAKVLSIILVLAGMSMGTSAVRNLLAGDFTVPGRIALGAILLSMVVKEGM